MDTDDLSNMAYQCINIASDVNDVLKSEIGAECSNHKMEDEYLGSILSHVKSIKEGPVDYLESWGIVENVELVVFNKAINNLIEHIEATNSTPILERN